METLADVFGPAGGGQALSRWLHYLAGITWVGILYFFNFVQAPALDEIGGPRWGEELTVVTRRANWWLRWSAVLTVATGFSLLWFQRALGEEFTSYFTQSRGTAIAWGSILGLIMFANVWLVIWPAQKRIILADERGETLKPEERLWLGLRARSASRCNVIFSIPAVFFMLVPSHWVPAHFVAYPGQERLAAAWAVFVILVGFLELAAVGEVGGVVSPANEVLFGDHRRTILWAFVLWVLLYGGGFEIVIAGRTVG
ncbi:MAG: hypothetical protein KatS3mg008_1212 [Acidimicrobiales bacterium]|nr:MAG: hypothetical protein KatS3mg008_1212 [Acidimicrobiales bacterium]